MLRLQNHSLLLLLKKKLNPHKAFFILFNDIKIVLKKRLKITLYGAVFNELRVVCCVETEEMQSRTAKTVHLSVSEFRMGFTFRHV